MYWIFLQIDHLHVYSSIHLQQFQKSGPSSSNHWSQSFHNHPSIQYHLNPQQQKGLYSSASVVFIASHKFQVPCSHQHDWKEDKITWPPLLEVIEHIFNWHHQCFFYNFLSGIMTLWTDIFSAVIRYLVGACETHISHHDMSSANGLLPIRLQFFFFRATVKKAANHSPSFHANAACFVNKYVLCVKHNFFVIPTEKICCH